MKDGIELENTINTMDAKSITKLIDKITKDKMKKEDTKIERNIQRSLLIKLLPTSEYYIDNSIIYIKKQIEKEESTDEISNLNTIILNEIKKENELDNYEKIDRTLVSQRFNENLDRFSANDLIKLMDEIKNSEDYVKARRIIERIKQLTEDLEMVSINRRG